MTDPELYAIVLGRIIRHWRVKERVSQRDLCSRTNLSQSALSRFENGDACPTLVELRGLAIAIDTDELAFVIALRAIFDSTPLLRAAGSARHARALVDCELLAAEVPT